MFITQKLISILSVKRIISFGLGLTLIIGLILPFPLEAGPCEVGYAKCLETAFIIGLIHPDVGIAYVGFCGIGYAWCLEFMA